MSDRFNFDDVFERGEKTTRAALAKQFDDLVSLTKNKSPSDLMSLRARYAHNLAWSEAEPAYAKRMSDLTLAEAQRQLAYVDDLLKGAGVVLEMLLPAQPISTFRPNKERSVRETLDPEVAQIRRSIQGKPVDEIRTLARTIDSELTALEKSIDQRTRESIGAHDFSLDRDRLTASRRRKELTYLEQFIVAAQDSGVVTQEQ